MNFTKHALAVVAATVALQAAPCQVPAGVSMKIAGQNAAAGYMCEIFQCTPHKLAVEIGSVIGVEMYGLADTPYILFAGTPVDSCYQLSWVLGGVAMDPPFMIVEVGVVPASGLPSKCGMDVAKTKLAITTDVPPGAELVVQTAGWPLVVDMPAFSRGIRLVAN